MLTNRRFRGTVPPLRIRLTHGTTTVQVALAPSADQTRTTLRFHQEHLAWTDEREHHRALGAHYGSGRHRPRSAVTAAEVPLAACQGRRVNAPTWAGRTTVKSRRSSVAISLTPNRSAAATTEASTVPSRQIAIARNQLGDSQPIGDGDRLNVESPTGKIAEEADLRRNPQTSREEVRDLGDNEGRHDERAGMTFEKLQSGCMVCIVGVDVGVQRPGVDHECAYSGASAATISSMRSETSLRPLRPAPAAPRRRRTCGPPRYASSASRLMSAMVVPLRLASCCRRASSPSGILTVVRLMYARILCARPVGRHRFRRRSSSSRRRIVDRSCMPVIAYVGGYEANDGVCRRE